MAYLKPQTPLKDLNSGDYFYPLTTIDQIITGTSRLSAFLSENGNLLNLNNIGNININGTSYFANTITGDILSTWHVLAGRPSNTTNFRTYFETVANLHHDNPNRTDSEMSYNRWFASNSDQTTYGPSALNLPVVDQHVLSFGIDNGVAHSRHIALDIRSNKMFLGGRVGNTWQNWSEVIVHDLDQTITGIKTFNGQVYFNNDMHWKVTTNWLCDTTTDNTEWSFDIGNSTNTGNLWQVWSVKNSDTILQCFNDNRHVVIPVHLAVGGYDNASYGLSCNSLICNNLQVQGEGWDSVGTIRIIDTRTDGGWHYPIFCTSPSIPNDSNVYLCLGKNASIGNAGGVRWYHASDNSGENLIGFEIQGVGTHLYTKRNGSSYATRLYGAVWNDYAEFRQTKNEIEPGRCIAEIGDDTLELTTKRLQAGCEIVSDTYGFAIGESEICKTPTAASGRVLAYAYEDRNFLRQHIGEPVCSGPNGTVSLMTPEEEKEWPSRIIGTISAIPDYEVWHAGHNDENNVDIPIQVNGRIWIRIR